MPRLSNAIRFFTIAAQIPSRHQKRNMTSLTPAILSSLRHTWLDGCPTEAGIEPSGGIQSPVFKRWFIPDPDFDAELKSKYAKAVEEASTKTSQELLDMVHSPDDALNMLLLLDQVPRNIYRGSEASKAYEKMDPLAEELAFKFTSPPLDYHLDPKWKDLPFFQLWFILPLMHSEKLSTHMKMRDVFASMGKCPHEVNQKQRETNIDFGKKHTAVIERFGRYPSRNEALGRKSTEEELDFIQSGPGW